MTGLPSSEANAIPDYDVVVVGAGNAALAAAVSAREAGAERVVVLEKAPREMRGGNTHYSGGLFRFAFDRVEDLLRIVPDANALAGFSEGVEPYPEDAFSADLLGVTHGRTDRELAGVLISNSFDTVRWMVEQGLKMEPAVSLGGVRVGNMIKWPRGAIMRAVHEGVGLSRTWFEIAAKRGVEIRYDSGALGLSRNGYGRVAGVHLLSIESSNRGLLQRFLTNG